MDLLTSPRPVVYGHHATVCRQRPHGPQERGQHDARLSIEVVVVLVFVVLDVASTVALQLLLPLLLQWFMSNM